MKVAYKVWLDHHGKAFGDGPYELLNRVRETKSLHQAASQMSMSYNKAWRLIQSLEKRLGYPLLERKVGGQSGGGSQITPEAKRLMQRYERFRKEVGKVLETTFKKHFKEI